MDSTNEKPIENIKKRRKICVVTDVQRFINLRKNDVKCDKNRRKCTKIE